MSAWQIVNLVVGIINILGVAHLILGRGSQDLWSDRPGVATTFVFAHGVFAALNLHLSGVFSA